MESKKRITLTVPVQITFIMEQGIPIPEIMEGVFIDVTMNEGEFISKSIGKYKIDEAKYI